MVVQIATPRVAWSSAIAHSRNYNKSLPSGFHYWSESTRESQAISSPLPLHILFHSIQSSFDYYSNVIHYLNLAAHPDGTGPVGPVETAASRAFFSMCRF
jgi:hypothetical protein